VDDDDGGGDSPCQVRLRANTSDIYSGGTESMLQYWLFPLISSVPLSECPYNLK